MDDEATDEVMPEETGAADEEVDNSTLSSEDSADTSEQDFDFSLDTQEDETSSYSLQWGEEGDGGIPQEMHEGLAAVAKDLGYASDKSARLLARSYQYWQEREQQENRKIAQDLRKEWGEKFNANIRETKKFWNETLKDAKIPPKARAILGSPYGMVLGNFLRSKIQGGEAGSFAGSSSNNAPLSKSAQIDAIYNDPKLARATWDQSDPHYAEVQAKLNSLMGIMN